MKPPTRQRRQRQRLMWLLAVMVLLGVARWWWPPVSDVPAPTPVSEAVMRKDRVVSQALTSPEVTAVRPHTGIEVEAPREEVAGNAFAVRLPPAPVQIGPGPGTTTSVKTVMAPAPVMISAPTVQQPPPPPLQVIGTWTDTAGFAVFVSSPSGTLIARPGVVLMGEYNVTAVTPQLLSLRQLSSKRDIQLPVPRGSGS